jgi:cation diffusion facilitator CzcD-associated flavoprotein CzcO
MRSSSPRRCAQLEVDEEWIHEIVRAQDPARPGRCSPGAPGRADKVRSRAAGGGEAPILGEDFPSSRTSRRATARGSQRIAFIPEGDLFQGMRSGKASVVTDEIERFVPRRASSLKSGKELEADIIVTATGFDLSVMGDIAFAVDGKPVTSPTR